MIARTLPIGLLGLFLMALPAETQAASPCAPYTKPITVDFTTRASAPIYNNRLNVAGIRNLFTQRGMSLSDANEHALGVTSTQAGISLKASSTAQQVRNGYCIYLDKIEARFGWERMEVFVASEFQPGSCEYNAVLDHENQHVTIAKDTLAISAPVVRATLEAVLSDQEPIFVANADRGADLALNAVYKQMKAPLELFQETLAQRNGAIDTDANYAAVAALCLNWKRK